MSDHPFHLTPPLPERVESPGVQIRQHIWATQSKYFKIVLTLWNEWTCVSTYILVPAQTDSTSKIYYATMDRSVKTTMSTQVLDKRYPSCMVNKNNLEPPGTRHRLHRPITGLLLHVDSWLSGSGNVLLSYSIIKFECIHFILCDSNTAHFILTLDWQVWIAIPPGQPMFQRFSTWGGPNTTIKFGPGFQLLWGCKYYVADPMKTSCWNKKGHGSHSNIERLDFRSYTDYTPSVSDPPILDKSNDICIRFHCK